MLMSLLSQSTSYSFIISISTLPFEEFNYECFLEKKKTIDLMLIFQVINESWGVIQYHFEALRFSKLH